MRRILLSLFISTYFLSCSLDGFSQGFETCALAFGSPINLTTAAPYLSNGNTCPGGSTNDYSSATVTCVTPSTTNGRDKIYYICAATTGKIKVDIGSFAIGCFDFANKPWLAPSISIWSGCPSTGTCIGGNSGAIGAVTNGLSATAQVTGGQCYYVMIDNYPNDCPCFSYNIGIQYVKDCDYATANPITVPTNSPYLSSGSTCSSDILNNYNNVGSTCVNQTTTTGRDRVYYFCATATGKIKVDMGITGLACTDIVNKPWAAASVTIWQGCPSTGTCIGGGTGGTGLNVTSTAQVTAGQCYYVMIDNLPTYCSCFTFNLAIQYIKDCSYAFNNPITIPSSVTDSTCRSDVMNSYNPSGATCIADSTTKGLDRVYYFCATTTGKVNITLTNLRYSCYDPVNSPFPMPSLSVWQGCPDAGTCVAGSPWKLLALDEATSLDVTAGQCYYILLDNVPTYCPCYKYKMNIDYVTAPATQPGCTNIDFNSGSFTGWYGTYGRTMAPGPTTAPFPIYTPAFYSTTSSSHTITSGAGTDPYGGFPVVFPGGAPNSARIGNLDTAGYGGATLEQKFTVTAANALLTYYYAAVVQDAGHNDWEQPFFRAEAFDCNGNPIACSQYLVVGGPGIPGFLLSSKIAPGQTVQNVYYRGWTPVAFDLTAYIGSCVRIKFTVGDCSQGAHFAYAYIDVKCDTYKKVVYTAQNCPDDLAQIKGPDGFASYKWTGPGIVGPDTTQNISINQSGNYRVAMKVIGDAVCTNNIDTAITITILPAFAKSTASTNAACGINNGTASVSVSAGGTPTYTYKWSNGATSATANGLSAGKYIVTITDAHGCTLKDSLLVTVDAGPTATMGASVNLLCGGSNTGSATVAAAGGSTNYTYSWSNGTSSVTSSTTHTATGLSAATYTVTIRDAGACTATSTVVITAPTPILPASVNTPSTCGASNGTASASATGGTGTLTYSWSNGSTAQTITGLAANGYTATVTDANGCTKTTNTTVANIPGPTSTLGASTNINCNGGNNGSTSVTATGGTAKYTYNWSNGASTVTSALTNSISGLTATGYTVTITDANGCTTTTNVTLTEPTPIVPASSSTPATCGSNSGTVSVSATGGSGTLSYNWSSGSTAMTVTGLAANGYTATITDANGCTATTAASVTNIGGATATMGASVNINCSGGNNGSTSVTATGGTANYTYSWSNGASTVTSALTNNISGLTAAGYTVTITDASGCIATTSVTITEPGPILPTPGNSPATCGISNGQISVTATGGTGTLSYSWSSGSTAQTVTGLAANGYTATITDANGCTATTSTTVANVGGATATMGVPVNINCNGGNNGSTSVTATGGTANYTYSWSNGASTVTSALTNSINGLTAAGYTVTITDASGCISTTNVTLTQPPPINPTAGNTPATCGNSNGSINVSATGGAGTLSYSWSSGSNAQTVTGLAANVYTATITDANGCTTTTSTTVANTPGPTSTMGAPVNINCSGGNNGSTSVTATGGTASYTYSWSNGTNTVTGALSNNITGLTAAGYTVTITDANGCTTVTNVTLTEPAPIVPNSSGTPTTCGGNNGTVNVNATGGTGTLSYSWSAGSTSQTVNGLAANTYTATVTDANGCTASTTASVSNIGGATATMGTPTNINCNGGNNGTANVTVSGGAPNYTYSWSNGASSITSQLSDNITGLTATNYTVTVTDANGCITITNITLTEPPPLNPTPASTPSGCGGSNGQVSVSVTGGTGTYSYNWSSGSTAQTVTGLAPNAYTVTITDANGCSTVTTSTVANIPGPVSTMGTPSNISCNGGNNGTANVSVTGGSGPFTYSWSNGTNNVTGGSSDNISGLTAIGYTVTITDGSGCTSITTVTLTEPGPILPVPASTPASCGSSNGTVSINATGGTGALSYNWSTGSSAQTVSGLAANTYSVTITDANGCSVISTAAITNIGGATATMGTPTNISCNGGNNGSTSVTVSGGTPGYTYSWSNGASTVTSGLTDNINGLAAGNYTVTITDNNGCIITTNVILTEPTAIVPVTGSSPASCAQSNGSANISASGGTGTLGYSWSSGGTGQTEINLAANTYTVTITDANSCSATAVATVNNSSGPTVSPLTSTNLKCFGDNNGTAGVTASGGTGGINYSWSTGGTAQTITGLIANTYTVTVSDGSGCQVISTVSITQPNPLALAATALDAKCNGSCDGQAVVIPTANSGTAPYSISWSTSSTNLSISSLCAGPYSVTITDANGCKKDSTVTVAEPAVLNTLATNTPADCNQSNGTADVTSSGGTPGTSGYTYSWSSGATTPTAINLGAATYTVTVTDNNGCTSVQTTTILNNSGVIAGMQGTTPATCFNGCNATATTLPTGGTGPYLYNWSNSATDQTASNLCQGTYTVTITDSKNCTSTTVTTITEPPALNLPAITPATVCIGQTTTLTASPSGGTPGYTIVWEPGTQSGATLSVQITQSTTYTVSVVDANGCTTATQTVQVNTSPPLDVNVNTVSPVCPGGSVTITGVASGGNGGPYNYTWLTTPVQNTPSITITPNAQETHTVVVSDGCGTPNDTAIVTVNVNPLPVVNFIADVPAGCPILCVNFRDNSTATTGDTITKWLWDFGDSTSTNQNPTACFDKSGQYSVKLTVQTSKGCSSTSTKPNMIRVSDNPVAQFTTTPTTSTIVNPTFQFNDQSQGAVSWLWDFGDPVDSKTGTNQNPSHKYSDVGEYCILLTVENAESCKDTVSHCVSLKSEFTFYVPNAFSPNGDNINETFNGKGIGIAKYKMIVFDRWGNLIFSTEDLNEGWNGKANGGKELAQQDVYVYKIILTDIFDLEHTYIGHISLVK